MTENFVHDLEEAFQFAPATDLDAQAGGDHSPEHVQHEPLPVTFEDNMTPFDGQGRYVPHYRDASDTVHFFSVVESAPESDAHELRYFRARKDTDGMLHHDAQPIMPVTDPATSPWPIPALGLYLEEGDLALAQELARTTAAEHGLAFPEALPELAEPESGWYHYDTALVLATPQGVDDGYSLGAVDVYRNHQREGWAARYLPMGEFDTLDDALDYQQQTLQQRVIEDQESAFSPAGFNDSPAIFERIALAEADAALTDLLEQDDGHLPPDYDGDHEPQWEPLTSKEWDAYRDHMQTVADIIPDAQAIWESLPTATPPLADDALVSASIQPDAPYLQPDDLAVEAFDLPSVAPSWSLEVVPAHNPEGEPLGYSAVCVMDFSDLAEALSPDSPERGQWLEVAQFQTEDRAQQFRDDFMSLVDQDEMGNITMPALAEVIADDLEMDSQWQTMDRESLDKLKAGEWNVTDEAQNWRPHPDAVSQPEITLGLDL